MKFIILSILCAWAFCTSAQVEKTGFIYESAPYPSCHASTIEETPGGLVSAWFGGKHEKSPDVGIWFSQYTNGTWATPVEIANGIQGDGRRYPLWNPVLDRKSVV